MYRAPIAPRAIVRKNGPPVADHFARVESRYARRVPLAATIVIVLVAVAHVWFAILEMVLWTKPIGIKTFGRPKQVMIDSASLAQNQGLYNLFLVAGLVWSLIAAEPMAHALKLFFLGCVLVAGIFGAITASKKILFVQAIPAAIGLALVVLSGT